MKAVAVCLVEHCFSIWIALQRYLATSLTHFHVLFSVAAEAAHRPAR